MSGGVALLPNVGNAMLDDAKITACLPNDRHPQNQGKAGFFRLFGFVPANWRRSKAALLEHPLADVQANWPGGASDAVPLRDNVRGGLLHRIAGRTESVHQVILAIEPPAAGPKFITACAAAPAPRGRARP